MLALAGLSKAMDGLTASMNKTVDVFKEAMAFGDEVQKASLALGQTYTQTQTQLGGTIQGLRGSMDQQMGAAIAGLEAGMQGNTAGVARLINQQMLTGTAHKKTATSFANMETALGLSRDQTNVLSNSLIQTGQEYQVSTDKLVEGMNALKASFGAMNMAGMGAQVQGAMAELTAELPTMGPQLQSVMKMVMDTSMEGYSKLTALGMGDVREQLAAAKNQTEAVAILKNAMLAGAQATKDVAGDVSKNFFMAGVAQQTLGTGVLDLVAVSEQLGKRIKTEGEDAVDFGMTLKTLKSEVLAPIIKVLADKFYPAILRSADAFSAIGQRIAKWLSNLIEKIPKVDSVIKMVTLKLIDFAMIGLNSLEKAWNHIKPMFENLSAGFMSIQTALHWGIVVPLNLVKGAFGAFETGIGVIILGIVKLAEVIARAISKISFGLIKVQEDNVEMLTGFAKSLIEGGVNRQNEAKNRIMMTPERSAALMAAAIKKANEDPSLLGNRMLGDLRDSFANGNTIQREQNDNLKKIEENTNEDTAQSSEFLNTTANSIALSMERVLGMGPGNDVFERMVTELEKGTALGEAQLEATPGAAESNAGQLQ